jgi:hypothetical protein
MGQAARGPDLRTIEMGERATPTIPLGSTHRMPARGSPHQPTLARLAVGFFYTRSSEGWKNGQTISINHVFVLYGAVCASDRQKNNLVYCFTERQTDRPTA